MAETPAAETPAAGPTPAERLAVFLAQASAACQPLLLRLQGVCGKAELVPDAICFLTAEGKPCGGGPEQGANVSGVVKIFKTEDGNVRIEYEFSGLKPGKHGFHIHEKSDFSDGCTSAGGHYNPHKKTHGGPDDEERHVGDLGNVEAGEDGTAKGEIIDKLVKVDGEFSVMDRSFMIHADADDLGKGDNSKSGPPPLNGKASKVTGNAGARIACGKIVKPAPVVEAAAAPEEEKKDEKKARTTEKKKEDKKGGDDKKKDEKKKEAKKK